MRQISTNISNIINSTATIGTFYLIKISTTPAILATTLPTSIIVGGDTYSASTKIVDIDSLVQATTNSKSEFKIALSDPNSTLEGYLNSTGFSANMTVRQGFMNPSTGLPYDTLADTVVVYEGIVDYWYVDMSEDKLTLVIQGCDPLSILDWSNSTYTSPESIKRFDSTDTSMDFIGAMSNEELLIRWGKAST